MGVTDDVLSAMRVTVHDLSAMGLTVHVLSAMGGQFMYCQPWELQMMAHIFSV